VVPNEAPGTEARRGAGFPGSCACVIPDLGDTVFGGTVTQEQTAAGCRRSQGWVGLSDPDSTKSRDSIGEAAPPQTWTPSRLIEATAQGEQLRKRQYYHLMFESRTAIDSALDLGDCGPAAFRLDLVVAPSTESSGTADYPHK
jgi:hypothetical protein